MRAGLHFAMLCICVLGGTTGCDRTGGGAATLPEIVQVDYSLKETIVQNQFRAAYEELASNATSSETNGRLGMLCQAYDELVGARAFYERAVALGPGTFRWQFYLGVVLKALGEQEQAIETLRRAARLRSEYLPVWAHLGEIYLAIGKHDEAERAYRKALDINPDCALAHYGLGRIETLRKNHETAARYLEESLAIIDAQESHYVLAIAYRKLGRMDEAQVHMLRSQQVKARLIAAPDPLRVQIDQLKRGGRFDFFRGTQMVKAGDYRGAIRYFESVVKSQPGLAPLAHRELAKIKGQQGNWTAVAESCAFVLESRPMDSEILILYGVALLQLHREKEAIPILERALEQGASPAISLANLGKAYMELGQFEESIAQYRRALEADPGFHKMHRGLARAFSRSGDSENAIESWRVYLKAVPKDASSWIEYAKDLQRAGRNELIGGALRKARESAPEDSAIQERIRKFNQTDPSTRAGQGT